MKICTTVCRATSIDLYHNCRFESMNLVHSGSSFEDAGPLGYHVKITDVIASIFPASSSSSCSSTLIFSFQLQSLSSALVYGILSSYQFPTLPDARYQS